MTADLPEPMAPLRPTDAPGTLVSAPSPEVFPGGGPGEPWQATPDNGVLRLSYEAGGVWVVADGDGAIRASIDGAPPIELERETALILVAHHERHEQHELRIEAAPDVRIWAISFAPGMP